MADLFLLKVSLGLYGGALATTITSILAPRSASVLRQLTQWIFFLAVGFHLATVVARGIVAHHFPVASFYESLLFISLTTALVLAFVVRAGTISGIKIGGLLILMTALLTALRADPSVEPLVPALRSIWIQIHVPFMMVSYGAFGVAAVTAVLDLTTQKRNPNPELEWLTAKLIAFGFIFLTIGILLGAVWANEAWGTYWGWDPKETCALLTWLIYAIYLHGKYVTGWKGARLSWVAVLGFVGVLFTYLGVSFLLSGLHSYIS